jgi:WD40 repeat protein
MEHRKEYERQLECEDDLLTDLTMNFDPFTITLLKKEFERVHDEVTQRTFVVILREHLSHWHPEMRDRDRILVKLLVALFKDIDINGNGTLQWDEFTNYILEKATTLTSRNKSRIDSIKNYSISKVDPNHRSEVPVERIVDLEFADRIGVIENYSNVIKFYHPETGAEMGRPLKIEADEMSYLHFKGGVVAYKGNRKAVVLNALAVNDPDLEMLMTSTNDCKIKCWVANGSNFHSANYEGGFPVLVARNAQRAMAWDSMHKYLFTGERGGTINIWNLGLKDRKKPFEVLKEGPSRHDNMITDLAAVPKLEFLFSSALDTRVILWDMITLKPKHVYKEHTKGVLALAFNTEYRLLFSAGFDHDIFVWNPYINSVAFTIEGHNSSLIGVRCVPDSPQVISADIDGWVKIWDIRNFGCVQSFNLDENHAGRRFSLADFCFLKTQQRLVFAGRTLSFYDYDRNNNPLLVDDSMPLSAMHSSYHTFLTPTPQRVKVWSAFTGDLHSVIALHNESEITCAELDGWAKRVILGDSAGVTRVYNIKNGALMKTLAEHRSEICALTSSVTLEIIVTAAADLSLYVHADKELRDTTVLKRIMMPCSIITMLIVPDQKLLVCGTSEGHVTIRDAVEQGNEGTTLHQQGEITAISFLKGYFLLVVADSTGAVVVWGLPPLLNKFSQVFSFTNVDSSDLPRTVLCMAMDNANMHLYTGDEKGLIKCFDLSPLCHAARNDERLFASLEPPRLVIELNCHPEGVRHLSFVLAPPAIISTGFDRRTLIFSLPTLTLIGSLQQGSVSNDNRPRERRFFLPWNLQINTEQLRERENEEIEQIIESLSRLAAADRIPSKVLSASLISHDRLSSLAALPKRTLKDFSSIYTIENARKGKRPLDLMMRKHGIATKLPQMMSVTKLPRLDR